MTPLSFVQRHLGSGTVVDSTNLAIFGCWQIGFTLNFGQESGEERDVVEALEDKGESSRLRECHLFFLDRQLYSGVGYIQGFFG
jgi:hypothetical protein